MRSNRPLTQFACRQIKRAVLHPFPVSFSNSEGNTTVSCVADGMKQRITVSLFDSKILELDVYQFAIHAIKVQFGSVFTNNGNPTKTTIERLNGLLELLGELHALPDGVRIFRCPDSDSCAIGKGSDYFVIGKNNYNGLMIRPSKSSFEVDGHTLNSGLVYWK